MLKKVLFLLGMIATFSGFAQDRGTPIFQDSFDTKDTFAENWVVGKGWNGRIKSSDGKVRLPQGGSLRMRHDTPAEFYVEMNIILNKVVNKNNAGNSFCGFKIEGFLFTITKHGGYWLAASPKGSGGTGMSGKIDGFQFGKPVKISLTRKTAGDAAKYILRINGKEAVTRVFNLKKSPNGKYKPLEIFSYNLDISVDDFGLFMVKRGDDDSPNLIFNSGFEHELDGFPPYYSTPSFNSKTISEIP